jgi:Cu+-exporting ATPase
MAHVNDPVCNATIDAVSAAGQTSYQGRNYYFCSEQCASRFQASPGTYAINASTPRSGIPRPPSRWPDARSR